MSSSLHVSRPSSLCPAVSCSARTYERRAKASSTATTTRALARPGIAPPHRRQSSSSLAPASNPLRLSRRGPAAPSGVRTWLRNTISDFGRKRRQSVLDAFYTARSAEEQVALLSDDFALREDGSPRSFGREQYGETMAAAYASVPDWNWTHATDALVDSEGYAIVTLQATGHFTGKPYTAPAHPEWPSLNPTGRRFALSPETAKVKVKDGKIAEIAVVPAPGGGPRGLYEALGGKMPSK